MKTPVAKTSDRNDHLDEAMFAVVEQDADTVTVDDTDPAASSDAQVVPAEAAGRGDAARAHADLNDAVDEASEVRRRAAEVLNHSEVQAQRVLDEAEGRATAMIEAVEARSAEMMERARAARSPLPCPKAARIRSADSAGEATSRPSNDPWPWP